MTLRTSSAALPSASGVAGYVLLASAVPLVAIAWMIVSGAAGFWPAFSVALATLAVDAVLIQRCVQRARDHGGETGFAALPVVSAQPLHAADDHHAADWSWQIDANRNLTGVSARLAYAFRQEAAALEGRSFLQLLAGDTWESGNFSAALRTLSEKIKAREAFEELILPVQIAGETLWWELNGRPDQDGRGGFAGFRGTGSDVTAERRSADKINRMARYDTLTGLPNRLHMAEAIGSALTEAEQWRSRCAFLIIDIDRFKSVNDTLGHAVGDRLLTRVGERLASLMTAKELCGRLGGDEFGVVIKDGSDQGRVEKLAHRIIDELSHPYDIDNHILYVGASIGAAIGPRDGNSAEMLMRSADLALHRAKDAGGGTLHVYEPQLHVNAEERRVMEIALRRALANKELELHYQPVVSAESGTIEGFEALMRWKNPQLGNVPPDKFIPLAEEARLIGPIGEWALNAACQEAVIWPSTVRVAVNISAEQLHDRNFAKSVADALQRSGLPPHRLELEVTESVFMTEAPHAIAVLRDVLAMGVNLSLDDFGTGYSSLGYLSRTKFSTIKIDRSFVQGASRNAPESVAIIRAVVALADSLGMATTAEGVETDDELAMIRRLGCRKVQGYLFGRPMIAADARALFTSGRKSAAA
ncbi:EAL domain-containing protein [Sphingomonas sp. ID1715]|uniref:putative bifunctional diguanylate cyclase/phosphodiesterase n=1 Tax=Sphingomonas sp. ID1715 TaxID=1656898 RepID=UPI001489D5D0|nr:EAL domain-containing protein [Sphingomonas sp. ID1715]NNM78159.1 EAL domain-containing protein [Sphingomonas sp. ID1715]